MSSRFGNLLFWTLAAILALAMALGSLWVLHHGYADWRAMSAAWTRAGTRSLLSPPQRWQIFAYLPATVYLLAPLAALSPGAGFVANALVMLLCAALAGLIAARVFALPQGAAVGLFVTWPPAVYAAVIGQNAPLGLLLTMMSIAGVAARAPLLTALPIGLLLYKPVFAVPLVGVLLVRRMWRECGIVAVCAIGWYVFSVVAAGYDWAWPATWWHLIQTYARSDLAHNAPLTVSATCTLLRFGVSIPLIVLSMAAVAAAGWLAVARAQPVEAATGATLLALAWSPHAWAYDATLALPMVAFVIGKVAAPVRTFTLACVYAVTWGFFFSRILGFDPMLVITVGGSSYWLYTRTRFLSRTRVAVSGP